MTDFDQFEQRLAAALRSDADERVTAPESLVIASTAIHRGQRHAGRIPPYRSMNVAARLAAAAVLATMAIGGAIYVLGPNGATVGGPSATPAVSPGPTKTSAAVQPVARTWTATGRMIQARDRQTATLLPDGRVLVAGGGADGTELAAAELYDPRTGSWTATASMADARMMHSATLLRDGTVLVAGGFSCRERDRDCAPLASAELYDPRTGSWTATGNMIAGGSARAAMLLPDGTVLVAGGRGGPRRSDAVASAEVYDPRTGAWTATGSMLVAADNLAATLLPDGTVLVGGELYDPGTGSWTATATMSGNVTSTLLPDGTVLVSNERGELGLFDPDAGLWTASGSMRAPMGQNLFTATLLPDGMVLVAGGAGNLSDMSFVADANLYDPSSGTWTATESLPMARKFHTATLLLDGTVLVAGGSTAIGDDGWTRTDSAELYGPDAGT